MERYSGFNPNVESLKKLFATNALAVLRREGMKRPKLISKGISDGSADRVLAGDEGQNLTLESLEVWASALKTPAWQLLHPDFDAADQLVVRTESAIETEVQRRLVEKLKPLLEGPTAGESRPDRRRIYLAAGEEPKRPPEAAKKRRRKRKKDAP